MPVKFNEYEQANETFDWAIDPDSNAYAILSFLAEHPKLGFTPKEIHEATDVSRGSVGTTLGRLEERGLVRHKAPYWAADSRGIEAYETVLRSHETVEPATAYDWGDADPSAYRIGLDAVSQKPDADGA